LKGFLLGIKRILRCHPIKVLGGRSGFDPAPNFKKGKK
jgi:putative component of membrane protein insertase Oxa1/YidC/SpoIIIJ protein YidD